MAFKFKSYEDQARLSVMLATVGFVCAIVAGVAVLKRFEPDQFWVKYGSHSMLLPVLGATLLLALAASGAGFFVALHSAGQRRNKRSRLSWTGFFLNAGVITITLSIAIFFALARNVVHITPGQLVAPGP